jgi:hypothetical protein
MRVFAQDGWCVHFDKMTKMCRVFESRPYFCRTDAEVCASDNLVPSPNRLSKIWLLALEPFRTQHLRQLLILRKLSFDFPDGPPRAVT